MYIRELSVDAARPPLRRGSDGRIGGVRPDRQDSWDAPKPAAARRRRCDEIEYIYIYIYIYVYIYMYIYIYAHIYKTI